MPNSKTRLVTSSKRRTETPRIKVNKASQSRSPRPNASRSQKWQHHTTWQLRLIGVKADSETFKRVKEEIPWTNRSEDGKLLFATADISASQKVHHQLVKIVSGDRDAHSESYELSVEDQARCPRCGKLGRFEDNYCAGCGLAMVPEKWTVTEL